MYSVLKAHEVVRDKLVAHNVGDFLAKIVRLTVNASGGGRDLDEGSEKLMMQSCPPWKLPTAIIGDGPWFPLST